MHLNHKGILFEKRQQSQVVSSRASVSIFNWFTHNNSYLNTSYPSCLFPAPKNNQSHKVLTYASLGES